MLPIRTVRALLVVAAACLLVSKNATADVSVSLKDGRATVIVHDAPVRQVLAEWARVGQTRILNLEKIPGGPVTLELRDVPERVALKVLLQSVAGYIAAPRPVPVDGASVFDRILILPTSVAVAAAAAPMRPTIAAAPAVFEIPDPTALANDEQAEPTDAQPPVFPGPGQPVPIGVPQGMQPPGPGQQSPPVQQFNPPPLAPPAQPQGPITSPTAGQTTASRPGVLPVPAQSQPGQAPQ